MDAGVCTIFCIKITYYAAVASDTVADAYSTSGCAAGRLACLFKGVSGGIEALFGGNGAFAGFCTTYYACLTILAGTCTNIAHGFPAGITAQL